MILFPRCLGGNERLEPLVIAAAGIQPVLVFAAPHIHVLAARNDAAGVLGPPFKELFCAKAGASFPDHLEAEHDHIRMLEQQGGALLQFVSVVRHESYRTKSVSGWRVSEGRSSKKGRQY
jgi:hypothetical protein